MCVHIPSDLKLSVPSSIAALSNLPLNYLYLELIVVKQLVWVTKDSPLFHPTDLVHLYCRADKYNLTVTLYSVLGLRDLIVQLFSTPL